MNKTIEGIYTEANFALPEKPIETINNHFTSS